MTVQQVIDSLKNLPPNGEVRLSRTGLIVIVQAPGQPSNVGKIGAKIDFDKPQRKQA